MKDEGASEDMSASQLLGAGTGLGRKRREQRHQRHYQDWKGQSGVASSFSSGHGSDQVNRFGPAMKPKKGYALLAWTN